MKENDASSSMRHSTACLNQELYFVWQPRRTPRTIAACHNVERGSSGLLSSARSQVDYKRSDKVLCWFRLMSFPKTFSMLHAMILIDFTIQMGSHCANFYDVFLVYFSEVFRFLLFGKLNFISKFSSFFLYFEMFKLWFVKNFVYTNPILFDSKKYFILF